MKGSRGHWALVLACGLVGCAGADRRMASMPPGLLAPANPVPAASRGGLFAARQVPPRPVMTSVSPTVASFFPGLAPRTTAPPTANAPRPNLGVGSRFASTPPPAIATAPGSDLGQPEPNGRRSSWLAFRPAFTSRTSAQPGPSPSPGPADTNDPDPEPLLPVALNVEVRPIPNDSPATRLVSHETLLPMPPPAPPAETPPPPPASDAPPPLAEAPPAAPKPPTLTTTPAHDTANPGPTRPAVALGSDAPPIPGGFGAMQLFPNSYYERAPAPVSVATPSPAQRAWRPWGERSRLVRGQRAEVPQGG